MLRLLSSRLNRKEERTEVFGCQEWIHSLGKPGHAKASIPQLTRVACGASLARTVLSDHETHDVTFPQSCVALEPDFNTIP